MFAYRTPPDEIVLKLREIGYPEEKLMSYPEIVIWLSQEKHCLVSVEPFSEETDVRLMGLVYFIDKKNWNDSNDSTGSLSDILAISETIKVGLFDDIMSAYVECVNFIFSERFYKLR